MKHLLSIIIITTSLLIAGKDPAFAQTITSDYLEERRQADSLEKIWMNRNLNISDELISRVFEVRDNYFSRTLEIRANSNLSDATKDSQAKSLAFETNDEIKKIMGSEVFEIYQDLIIQRLKKRTKYKQMTPLANTN